MNEYPQELGAMKKVFEPLLDELSILIRYMTAGEYRQCGGVDMLNYPGGIQFANPGLGLDWIPEEARGTIESLIVGAGMTCLKHDGSCGEDAYFTISQEDMTAEKLALMQVLAMFENDRFMPGYLKPAKAAAAMANVAMYGKDVSGKLEILEKLVSGLNLPGKISQNLTRGIAAAARTAGELSAA